MRLRTTTTLLLVIVAAVAIGCGSDKKGAPLPAESAAALQNQLTSIQNRFNAGGGACRDITGGSDPNTRAVDEVIKSLPDNVDKDLRDAVQQSFDHLFDLTDGQCDESKGQQTNTEPTPAPAPETTTTPPPQTETTTTPTTPTTPTQTEQQPPQTDTGEQSPPGQGGASPGQGNENGQGGGGDQGASDGGALVPGNTQ